MFICLAITGPVSANFHLMRINELMAQAGGDPRVQFIELEMTFLGQNFVGGHQLHFFDATGKETGVFMIPGNVTNGGSVAPFPSILFGTQAFADHASTPPDFIIPDGLLSPYSGKVCFEAIDCCAYGDYAGDNTGYGAPAERFGITRVLSLTRVRTTEPKNNSTDFAFGDPSPKKNNGTNVVLTVSDPPCLVTDSFADLSKWDVPAANAGLDLTSCGAPIDADIGTVTLGQGAMILTPGIADQLGLGVPICFTGLSHPAALPTAGQNYRVKLDMLAHRGIAIGAIFTRQKYSFDDAAKTIDIGQSSGMGINFSIDELNREMPDHVHSDVRSSCIQDVTRDVVPGKRQFNYPAGFLLSSETKYTWILDVDGDDVAGPITLQVKVFDASDPEPVDYVGTFKAPTGITSASPDEGLLHGVLIAALGLDAGAGQPSMEISDFSICGIPRNQQHVRCLSCARQDDGTILVSWQNPADAETDKETSIFVNGSLAGMVDGDEAEFIIATPPEGELKISVLNYSGIQVECTVCANHPPQVLIDGPKTGELQDGTLTVALDSTASNDGDDGSQALARAWEILSVPEGGNASIDDPGAVVVNLNVHADGDYKIRLTITDSGCEGDAGISASADHTLHVGAAGGMQKPGDMNQDGKLDLSDAVALLDHLFLGGPRFQKLPCEGQTAASPGPGELSLLDANHDRLINIADPIFVLQFLFGGGPKPFLCADADCGCVVVAGCSTRCN
jgi:hypothetical protein